MDMETMVERYVGVWNEVDPLARRRTIEELWTPGGRHCMGSFDVTGHDELERRVTASNARNIVENGSFFAATGPNEELPGLIKFRWEMRERNGSVGSAGVGVLLLDESRSIVRDYLFVETD